MGHIVAKCLEKSNFTISSSWIAEARKSLYYMQKVTKHPDSMTKVGQVLASSLVTLCPKDSPVTSVIINSGVTYHFFSNQDLFTNYSEYEHKFQTGRNQKIAAHSDGNVDLRLSDHEDNINILTTTNMKCASKLGQSLLDTLAFDKKDTEVFLRKTGQSSEIIADNKVFGLVGKIENQYVIQLA